VVRADDIEQHQRTLRGRFERRPLRLRVASPRLRENPHHWATKRGVNRLSRALKIDGIEKHRGARLKLRRRECRLQSACAVTGETDARPVDFALRGRSICRIAEELRERADDVAISHVIGRQTAGQRGDDCHEAIRTEVLPPSHLLIGVTRKAVAHDEQRIFAGRIGNYELAAERARGAVGEISRRHRFRAGHRIVDGPRRGRDRDPSR
jgi:hypothetical protein